MNKQMKETLTIRFTIIKVSFISVEQSLSQKSLNQLLKKDRFGFIE